MKIKCFSLLALTAALPMLAQAAQETKEKPAPASLTSAETNKGFFAHGAFIYWHVAEEGLEYAVGGINDLIVTTTFDVHRGKLYSPDFKFAPGFKAGIGYTLPQSKEWDISLNYTWLTSSTHNSVSSTQLLNTSPSRIYAVIVHPVFVSGTAGAPIRFGEARWKIHYQTLDLELAREMQLRKRFSFKPHGGLRAGWIDQNLHVNYQIASSVADPALITFQYVDIPMKNDFVGVGLRAGIDSIWHFNKYWGLFANLATSLVWGRFTIHETMTETRFIQANGVNAVPRGKLVDVRSSNSEILPEIDIALGLQSKKDFNSYSIEANLGWEYTLWFNQNQLLLFNDRFSLGKHKRYRGNLTMQGLTLDVKFHF